MQRSQDTLENRIRQNLNRTIAILKMGEFMLKIGTDFLWSIAIVFLIGGSIYFTWSLSGVQFHFKKMILSLKKTKNVEVTPFESLTMALAARVGVGSLAGIALAIHLGGPGSIFWIWITGILTAANTFVESTLSAKYQEKDDQAYKGGPSYYMDKGLNKKNLAKLYAFVLIIAYIFGFITIQSNTIVKSIEEYIHFPSIFIGIFLSLLTGYIIIKGVTRIAHITGKLVPIMGIGYFLLCMIIIIKNMNQIPSIIVKIITSAFDIKSFGIGVLSTFIIGIQRGVFSTEAGLGSGAIASSTTKTEEASTSGLIQVLGIYLTVFVICTLTAFVILTSNYELYPWTNMNGIELTKHALTYHLGSLGNIVLLFSILTFAYSTIISGYYYGESSLKYLLKNPSNNAIWLLKGLTLLLIIFGSFASPTFLWDSVDMFVAILAILNMYSLFSLRKIIKKEWEHYRRKEKI